MEHARKIFTPKKFLNRDCSSTYPDLLLNLNDISYLRDIAILTSTLSVVEEVNNAVLAMLPGAEKVYLSADSVSKQDCDVCSFDGMHSTEFLNSLKMFCEKARATT